MRVLAVDVGERRIGLAISDVSRTLARPLLTLTVKHWLDGSPNDQTPRVAALSTR
jgi:RNase H-fold protein (predicted Holliday junction resolvase)